MNKQKVVAAICLVSIFCLPVSGMTAAAKRQATRRARAKIEWSPYAKSYLSKIENMKLNFLKHQITPENYTILRWIAPDPRAAVVSGISLAVYRKNDDKLCFSQELQGAQAVYECKLEPGAYYATIRPYANSYRWSEGSYKSYKQWGRSNTMNFKVKPYIQPLPSAAIEKLVKNFMNKYDEAKKIYKLEKTKSLLTKWLFQTGMVSKVEWYDKSVMLKLKDRKKFTIDFRDAPKEPIGEPISEPDEPDGSDMMPIDLPTDDDDPDTPPGWYRRDVTAPMATTCPLSNSIIVLDALTPDRGIFSREGYARSGGIYTNSLASLETMGYTIDTILFGSRMTTTALTSLDEGNYGIILYASHGGLTSFEDGEGTRLFRMTTRPIFATEAEALASGFGGYLGTTLIYDRINVGGWAFAIDRRFIENYLNDVPFPGSFFYAFACGSGMDAARDTMFYNLYWKGVTTGWVGFDAAEAIIQYHMDGTWWFFRYLIDPSHTLGEAVESANAAPLRGPRYLRLFDDEDADNNLYIQLPDLVVRSATVSSPRELNVTIANIGDGIVYNDRHIVTIRAFCPDPERGSRTYTGRLDFDRLAHGDTAEGVMRVNLVPGSEISMDVRVDLDRMVESNEDNNVLSTTVTVPPR